MAQCSTQNPAASELPARQHEAISRATGRLRSVPRDYAFALISVLVCLLLRWCADPVLHDGLPFAFFIVPIMLTAWRCGLGPSLFATALSLLVGFWFFVEPRHKFAAPDAVGWTAMGIYLFTASVICFYSERMRKAGHLILKEMVQGRARQKLLAAELAEHTCAEEQLRQSEQRQRALIGTIKEGREALARSNQELERLVQERTTEVEWLKSKLQQENAYLREKVKTTHGHCRLVGQSPALQRVLAQVEQVAPADSTVLLLGETGTGKELLAISVHELSSRRDRTMVSVNCSAIPAPLIESELFGREKGAFTGSLSRQIGRFELAEASTIFLDEVGDLPPEVQSKLLRVLESKQIERLGNPRPVPVNVRIIAATNCDLEKAVSEGKFRQDLYYRLNVFPIQVAPLRERREDIPLLVWAFVDEFAKTFNKNIQSVDRESMDALQRYPWPGNVRELRNLVERAMIVATGSKLCIRVPPTPTCSASMGGRTLEEVEREHVLRVMEQCGWRIRGVNGAAGILRLKPTTLEAKMAKLGIHRPCSTC